MSEPTVQSDDALLRRYREGDEEAFCILFEGHAPLIQAHIQQRLTPLLQRKVSVADVLQDVRICAHRRRRHFEGTTREAFGRWLIGIAERSSRQTARWHLGAAKRSVGREISRDRRAETADLLGGGPSPSQEAIASEVIDLAEGALETLSEDYRDVLRLVREEKLSMREVAERMDRSYEATRKLHQRAMFQFTEAFRRMRGREDD